MGDNKEKLNPENKTSFLYPYSRYYGTFTPENVAFSANLQEFSQKISYIAALETGGKLSPEDAYQKIEALWKQLKQSKQELAIGKRSQTD